MAGGGLLGAWFVGGGGEEYGGGEAWALNSHTYLVPRKEAQEGFQQKPQPARMLRGRIVILPAP